MKPLRASIPIDLWHDGGVGTMGDLKCPKCGNNSFQVRSRTDAQRATFICISCWGELRLEDMTRQFLKRNKEPLES
jgi:hypothetical protein